MSNVLEAISELKLKKQQNHFSILVLYLPAYRYTYTVCLNTTDHRRSMPEHRRSLHAVICGVQALTCGDLRCLFSTQRRLAVCLADCLVWIKVNVDDEAVRVAVGLRLGLDLCVPHECHCGCMVDARGVHSFVCKKAPGRTALGITPSTT